MPDYRKRGAQSTSGRADKVATSEELLQRPFPVRCLGGRVFFDWHEFVAELLSLPFELRCKALLSLNLSLGQSVASYSTCFFTNV